MDLVEPPTPLVVDRRRAPERAAWIVALLAAFGVGRAAAPSGPDPDADLMQDVYAATARAERFWQGVVGPPRWRPALVNVLAHPTATACGQADQQSGPFYCPADGQVYLDLSFLRAIDGDLARAYVIAHELGHHVQRVVGDAPGATPVSVELEADCYAGTWMRDELDRGRLDNADVAGALQEAAAVGDDRICPTCSPESWTHGSAEMRVAAVVRGLAGESCR